jgi:hypothetical protein
VLWLGSVLLMMRLNDALQLRWLEVTKSDPI